MEFDKSRVYTALNADELKVGSIVCVADSLSKLKSRFYRGKTGALSQINSEDSQYRFRFETCDFALAYLIEPPEEKVLKWTDLKVGDIITTKDGSQTAMVIRINLDGKDSHINIGFWVRDTDLETYWEKKED